MYKNAADRVGFNKDHLLPPHLLQKKGLTFVENM